MVISLYFLNIFSRCVGQKNYRNNTFNFHKLVKQRQEYLQIILQFAVAKNKTGKNQSRESRCINV